MSETPTSATADIRPIIETQPERTDLPLAVMPVVVASMIPYFKENISLLHDVVRLRMYCDFTLDEDTIVERCQDADAVMVIGFHVADAIFDRLTQDAHVRCFAFGGTGVASYINLQSARERGVRVCNVVRYGDHAVAEHTFALLMELARHVGDINRQVHAGSWEGADGYALHGKTVGLVGFGVIGQVFARMLQGFGMNVLVWNSHLDQDAVARLGVTPVDDMSDMFEQSDIISLHMPLLAATKGIITAQSLEHIKPGTLFINTARAEVIEQGALAKRLARGDVKAALDVFEHEPLAQDDPLRQVPGIILTPHVAWRNEEAYHNLTRQVFQSVASFAAGGDFNAVVK